MDENELMEMEALAAKDALKQVSELSIPGLEITVAHDAVGGVREFEGCETERTHDGLEGGSKTDSSSFLGLTGGASDGELEDIAPLIQHHDLKDLFQQQSGWVVHEIRSTGDYRRFKEEILNQYLSDRTGLTDDADDEITSEAPDEDYEGILMKRASLKESLRKELHRIKKYQIIELEEEIFKGRIAWPSAVHQKGSQNPHHQHMKKWIPVQQGWRSEDRSLICVKSGTIPKFEYRGPHFEEQNEDILGFGPPPPQIIWSGLGSYDDQEMNYEIAWKMFGAMDEWKQTPLGMYIDDTDDESNGKTIEGDINWSGKGLSYRLMLACNSVHGSNVSLLFDPEELDTPTLDFDRNFHKQACLLEHEYPSYVWPTRSFDDLGQLVVVPPPLRKDRLPGKPILKTSDPQWRLTGKRQNNENVRSSSRKMVRFELTDEQEMVAAYHPRANGWCRLKNTEIRRQLKNGIGILDMLPSVRACLTRIHGFERCVLPEDLTERKL
ncbi:hypothetical protein ABW19_dt0204072 [Dactylella cylindrospora]|nr:hypothetical protein ABW19_dt0204072 [Dactylella cylindrospora]